MTERTITSILLLVLTLCTPWVATATTLIHAGQLLAVPGEPPLTNQTIVIEDKRIVEVRSGYIAASEFAADTIIIDLRSQFVMPGLIDTHVHLQDELGPNKARNQLKVSSQLMQMRSLHYAKKTLLAGFTTVRDAGSSPQEMYALRDAINRDWADGPRIIAAGGVGITGGHADISGVRPDLMEFW